MTETDLNLDDQLFQLNFLHKEKGTKAEKIEQCIKDFHSAAKSPAKSRAVEELRHLALKEHGLIS